MKKIYKEIIYLILAITVYAIPSYSQTTQPVKMQYVGSQQYIGQSQQIRTPQKAQTAPVINSIYAQPMQRVNEIPLYGKNKSTYFYSQPKEKNGMFSDGNLYMFGSFATGKTTDGVNLQDKDISVYIGSDAHEDMGNPTGLTIGFGRAISSTFNVELFYSKYTGMDYGPSTAQYFEDEVCYEYDYEAGECLDSGVEYNVHNDFEKLAGGGISSDFFGVGFQYNLDTVFGSLFGGMLKPYLGFQVGFAMNNIDDYVLSDAGYTDGDLMYDYIDNVYTVNPLPIGTCTSDSPCYQYDYTDGELTYVGKNNNTFGYALEAGVTLALESNMEIDFFFKRNMLGKVETSGNVLSSYYVTETEFIQSDANGTDCAGKGYNWDGNWCYYELGTSLSETMEQRIVESGDVYMDVFGIKLKYMF